MDGGYHDGQGWVPVRRGEVFEGEGGREGVEVVLAIHGPAHVGGVFLRLRLLVSVMLCYVVHARQPCPCVCVSMRVCVYVYSSFLIHPPSLIHNTI